MKKLNLIVFVGLAVILFISAVDGYAGDGKVRLKKGAFVDKYWLDKNAFENIKTITLSLGDIEVGKIKDKEEITAEECKLELERIFNDEKNVLTVKFNRGDMDKKLRIDFDVEQMDTGSHAGRLIAGEFGLGEAYVKITGNIIDVNTGDKVFILKDKEGATGSWGLQNLGGNIGDKLVKRVIGKVSENFVKEINYRFARIDGKVKDSEIKLKIYKSDKKENIKTKHVRENKYFKKSSLVFGNKDIKNKDEVVLGGEGNVLKYSILFKNTKELLKYKIQWIDSDGNIVVGKNKSITDPIKPTKESLINLNDYAGAKGVWKVECMNKKNKRTIDEIKFEVV
jgi:hypothetical protein